QRADVGVADGGDRPRFTLEPIARAAIGCDARRQHLQGERSIEAPVPRAIHLPHPPGAGKRDDVVGADPAAREIARRGGALWILGHLATAIILPPGGAVELRVRRAGLAGTPAFQQERATENVILYITK